MRTSLLALAFGALLLTGCADDLTGPDVAPLAGAMSAARPAETAPGPIGADDAAAALFSTWIGTDGVHSFDIAFTQQPAPDAPDIFEAPADFFFVGSGMYGRLDTFTKPVPCRIVDGTFADNTVTFQLIAEDGLVAHAKGRLADDLRTLDVHLEYADGSVEPVSFRRPRTSRSKDVQ